MASNTTYIPNGYPLDTSKLQAAGKGVMQSCAALTTTNLDIDLTDDTVIAFVEVLSSGISIGDYISLKVVQTSNKSNVLATPIPGPWYLLSNNAAQFRLETPMKLTTGMTLRMVVQTTVPLIVPTVAVNYGLWTVLV